MTRTSVLLLLGLAVVAVAVWGVLLSSLLAPSGAAPSSGLGAAPSAAATATARPTALPSRAPATTAPSGASTPSTSPSAEAAPGAGSDDRSRYLAFVAQLGQAAQDAERLSAVIRGAAADGSKPAIGAAASDILAWSDDQRVWLRGNPPTPCYAAAHDAAGDLVAAYTAVAEATLTWVDASGLEALEALAAIGGALDAAGPTGPALQAELEGSSACLD